eukprot:GILI01002813.1.p1 GENE.GILI01002813.1~~GILI01002813.1.p1  ORF type:complete len:472 (+),score=75.06 GILI01002813.1:222-1637(+)
MQSMSVEPLDWRFTQVFGEKSPPDDITEADVLSAIEFDDTGDYLAVGDRGGRIIIFNRQYGDASSPQSARRSLSAAGRPPCQYKYFTEFQSHEPEFDYLKSLEIEEKINRIRWCKRQSHGLYILSTNDKTVKLWKVYEKKIRTISDTNFQNGVRTRAVSSLSVPRVTACESVVHASARRVYANAHAYHINSISLSSDGEHFFSADDLRINLWNINISNQTFNIVDIKPSNMEELTEVITSSEFHPQHAHMFMYSSSRGTIKLGDLRESSLCDRHAKLFEEPEDPSQRTFFSEIVASISDVKFTKCGRYIVSRDYMNVKVWDLNMEARPLKTIPIHEHLRPKLCDLYDSESIFDKFEVTLSPDSNWILTGSYNNNFHIVDRFGKTNTPIEASKSPSKKKNSQSKTSSPMSRLRSGSSSSPTSSPKNGPASPMLNGEVPETLDHTKKVLHCSWHPTENCVAVAGLNCLYIYNA